MMVPLPPKLVHALNAMIYIALQHAESPVSSRDIAAYHQLPPRYLEQMMQLLVKAGLLRGVRGPRGGYVLAKEKRRINLFDIYAALQSSEDHGSEKYSPNNLAIAKLTKLWEESQHNFHKGLQAITLESCVTKPVEKTKQPLHNANYTI
jgi:Rrf2 family protein